MNPRIQTDNAGVENRGVLYSIRLVVCATILASIAGAQNPSATATGSVMDQSGAAVPGAMVALTGVDTGVVLKAQTHGAGDVEERVRIGYPEWPRNPRGGDRCH